MTIVILNLSATSLAFNFFQYVDFDLGGLADDDTVGSATTTPWCRLRKT